MALRLRNGEREKFEKLWDDMVYPETKILQNELNQIIGRHNTSARLAPPGKCSLCCIAV